MKILLVMGTRPEAIKLAPLAHGLRGRGHEVALCFTGQHEELVRPIYEWFELSTEFTLETLARGQSLTNLLSKTLDGVAGVIEKCQPEWVGIQGDTMTTVAGALASFLAGRKVFHVEAGLRTGDLQAPWPEEGNRKLVTQVTNMHFAPTLGARESLIKEGVHPSSVLVTGNTVVDALLWSSKKLDTFSGADVTRNYLGLRDRFILITGHRRENLGRRFDTIFYAITLLADKYPGVDFVYPVHLNPAVQEAARKVLGERNNIKLIEPLGYPEFVRLMRDSMLIISDSGGIQEEAPSFGKKVFITRDITERPEAIRYGLSELVGADESKLIEAVERELKSLLTGNAQQASPFNPYGDGKATERILDSLDALNEGRELTVTPWGY